MNRAETELPRICIAIPAYNAEMTLPATLESIVAQDFEAWEVSVVDDGSIDGTRSVIEAYASRDSRIHFVSQENAGTGAAMNVAFENAQAQFIAQFGADDELLPGYMRTMTAFMDAHSGYDIYSCNAWIVDDSGRRLYAEDPANRPWISLGLKEFLEGQPYFFAGGALIRRSVFLDIGGFRPEIYTEDVDFGRRALAYGATHIYCPEPLVVYYRNVVGQKTSDRRRILESFIQIDEDLLRSGTLSSEQVLLVSESLAKTRQRLALGGTPGELARKNMERQSAWLRNVVSAVAGRRSERVLKRVRLLTRPTHAMRLRLGEAVARTRGAAWRFLHNRPHERDSAPQRGHSED
jgi:glycosyltransferase involved in cell wall biosynthesis